MRSFQSIILVVNSPEEYLKTQLGINIHSPNPDIYCVNPEKSTGIETVREALTYATRIPMTGSTKHLVFLKGDTLTPEAQNALLKLLEEPPPYLITILVVPEASVLIDTIISRCHIVKSLEGSSADSEVDTALYLKLCSLPPPLRLSHLPASAKAKEEAISFLHSILLAAQHQYRHEPNTASLHNLACLSRCLEALYKNANPTISLTNTLLQLV